MAELVLIYGRSGTGKSTSLRNFKPDEVAIINVKGKRLPFKNELKCYVSNDYIKVENAINKAVESGIKSIVVDDATYLMADEFMRNISKAGFQKFNDIAANFNGLLECLRALPEDVIVYIMGHSDTADDGREHLKSVGKAVDNYITPEGLCTIVLKTVVNGSIYQFQTQNNGLDTCKSPLGMFNDMLIDNDLKAVDTTIREYYGITQTKEAKKEAK